MKRSFRWLWVLLCLTAPAAARAKVPHLIDVHFHYDGEPGLLDKLLQKLDRVDGMALLLTTPRSLPEAKHFIQEHPTRLAGFGDVKLDSPDVLQQIDRFHAAGFLGLGEITQTLKPYDDTSYWPIYDRAEKYHMILLFHTGIVNRMHPEVSTNASFERSRATRLDLIARHWPKLIIIGAHLGNPDYAEAAEIGRWNPNLYFDLSGSSLLKKKDDYVFFRSIFWWSGVASPHTPGGGADAFEKLVFASDVFGGELQEFDDELARYHAMLDACHVPEHAQQMIFSGTMWQILKNQQALMGAGQKNQGRNKP